MRPEEVTVRALLGGILLFIVSIIGKLLLDSGAKAYIVVLWCAGILLLGSSAAGPLRMMPKPWSLRILIIAIILILIALVLQLRIIPVCGDDVCGAGECSRCAKDCTPAMCADNVCQPKVERCDTSADCACTISTACAPEREGADERGCAPVSCGDGFCDSQESSESCCKDCGCANGYTCERNACFFEVPKVTMSPYLLTGRISAASLAGNPMLTDGSGNSRPLMRIDVRTTKPIENVSARITIPGILTNTVPIGTLYAEQEVHTWWYVTPDSRLMSVAQDMPVNATVTLTYNDAFKNRYSINRSLPLILLSRNTLDAYGHVVLFTDTVSTAARTPQGIWDELGAKVRVETRARKDIVQYPQETLAKGSGSPQDIAVLLASAYNTAGLRTYLIETQEGISVRVWNDDRFVMLDPALLGRPFDEAISFTPGAGVYGINQTMAARNFTRIDMP